MTSLRIKVGELLGRPGASKRVETELPCEGLELATTDVRITSPVQIDVTISTIVDGLAVNGDLHSRWESVCRRCLDPVAGQLDVPVDELCSEQPEEGETWPIEQNHVDLEPIARELAMLALPLAALCGADCAGPDPDAVTARSESEGADGEAEHDGPSGDPRWAALDALKFDEL